MNYDILLSGVGGQGVLSVSAVIAMAALEEGLYLKQSEVHGMSQRGGAVSATLRLSDAPIHSPLISLGSAHMLLSLEPMECFRYLNALSKNGILITSTTPVKNIENYPDLSEILAQLRKIPQAHLINTEELARSSGSLRATNIVMVGAASRHLPLQVKSLERAIHSLFERKGDKIVEINLKAFQAGRQAV